MLQSPRIDARPDQLKLLKFERRTLRPMAVTTLDRSVSKQLKIAAVAGVATAFMALQSVSENYVDRLGVNPAIASQSSAVIAEVCRQCDQIAGLIDSEAGEPQLMASLAKLFTLIDSEHERLEKVGIKVGARLVGADRKEKAIGTGGKEDNKAWLASFSRADGDGDEIGTGGKEKNGAWLAALVGRVDGDGDGIGTGGKEENSAWLAKYVGIDRR